MGVSSPQARRCDMANSLKLATIPPLFAKARQVAPRRAEDEPIYWHSGPKQY